MDRIIATIPNKDILYNVLEALENLGFIWESGVSMHQFDPSLNEAGELTLNINLLNKRVYYSNANFESIEHLKDSFGITDALNTKIITVTSKNN